MEAIGWMTVPLSESHCDSDGSASIAKRCLGQASSHGSAKSRGEEAAGQGVSYRKGRGSCDLDRARQSIFPFFSGRRSVNCGG
jgi:hypothetical protein